MSGRPTSSSSARAAAAEVSPYITECPYCGTRLRKRAPKIERDGTVRDLPLKPKAQPRLGRLRTGEIPGIRGDLIRRPYATLMLIAISLGITIAWNGGWLHLERIVVLGKLDGDWWKPITSNFAYTSTGYAFVALTAIGIFGWLVERRHGPAVVVAVALFGGAGGMLVATAVESLPIALGGNGMALALLAAWAMRDLLALRAGEEIDGDLLGVAAFAACLLVLPAAVNEADAIVGLTGLLVGIGFGIPLSRLPEG